MNVQLIIERKEIAILLTKFILKYIIALLFPCNTVIYKQMKDSQYSKRNSKQLKLPQISSKTSSSFSSQSSNISSRIRPTSSDTVNQLEKNLFTQLNQYDDVTKKVNKKSKARKGLECIVGKQQITDQIEIDAPYLKKLQKLLPDTYNKLVASTKPQPLPQNKKMKSKKVPTTQLNTNIIPSSSEFKKNKITSNNDLQQQKKSIRKQENYQNRENSFSVTQRQVEAIFQKYLQQEGLTDLNRVYSSKDLQELNAQINSTNLDIQELKKSFHGLINTFSQQCLEEN